MAKRKQTIEIGGENFTIENKTIDYANKYLYYTLDECYDRPSDAKRYIYNKYLLLLAHNTDLKIYGVKSYNTFNINLHAIIRVNGVDYYAFITPSYNRLYRIESEA